MGPAVAVEGCAVGSPVAVEGSAVGSLVGSAVAVDGCAVGWNQKPNSQSNFCFPCYECVLLPEVLVLLVGVTLRRFGGLGCNIVAV